MNMEFSKIISSIQAEIRIGYIPSVIAWADSNHDGAWSKATSRFETALSNAMPRMDYTVAKAEGERYRDTCVELIRKFKAEKNMSDADSFLGGIATDKNIDTLPVPDFVQQPSEAVQQEWSQLFGPRTQGEF